MDKRLAHREETTRRLVFRRGPRVNQTATRSPGLRLGRCLAGTLVSPDRPDRPTISSSPRSRDTQPRPSHRALPIRICYKDALRLELFRGASGNNEAPKKKYRVRSSWRNISYPDHFADQLAHIERMRRGKIHGYKLKIRQRVICKGGAIAWGRPRWRWRATAPSAA